jgi:hypothetical protein
MQLNTEEVRRVLAPGAAADRLGQPHVARARTLREAAARVRETAQLLRAHNRLLRASVRLQRTLRRLQRAEARRTRGITAGTMHDRSTG